MRAPGCSAQGFTQGTGVDRRAWIRAVAASPLLPMAAPQQAWSPGMMTRTSRASRTSTTGLGHAGVGQIGHAAGEEDGGLGGLAGPGEPGGGCGRGGSSAGGPPGRRP